MKTDRARDCERGGVAGKARRGRIFARNLQPRSNDASRPAPPQDRPWYFPYTLPSNGGSVRAYIRHAASTGRKFHGKSFAGRRRAAATGDPKSVACSLLKDPGPIREIRVVPLRNDSWLRLHLRELNVLCGIKVFFVSSCLRCEPAVSLPRLRPNPRIPSVISVTSVVNSPSCLWLSFIRSHQPLWVQTPFALRSPVKNSGPMRG